ncbi:hypothetical protein FDG2_0963 [Candidatus Protofrankia californiensis]|uniref:Uncharacterized protein n=1 Tax=Candidatus Protofrankia californiensis TaxID=1839754 RepID=A0A1C3NUR9_9ACTN|nr:hypothetical protein FDG2_0963 [Candidatus Protofrankia californiensis]
MWEGVESADRTTQADKLIELSHCVSGSIIDDQVGRSAMSISGPVAGEGVHDDHFFGCAEPVAAAGESVRLRTQRHGVRTCASWHHLACITHLHHRTSLTCTIELRGVTGSQSRCAGASRTGQPIGPTTPLAAHLQPLSVRSFPHETIDQRSVADRRHRREVTTEISTQQREVSGRGQHPSSRALSEQAVENTYKGTGNVARHPSSPSTEWGALLPRTSQRCRTLTQGPTSWPASRQIRSSRRPIG